MKYLLLFALFMGLSGCVLKSPPNRPVNSDTVEGDLVVVNEVKKISKPLERPKDVTWQNKQVASRPEKRLFTDTEVQAFIAKLPEIKYPTTIPAACAQLGIDLARLGVDESKSLEGQIWKVSDRELFITWSIQLSESDYSIYFKPPIDATQSDKYRIESVMILKDKK